MSDEGMSDAPWLEHFVTSQDALGGMTFAHYRDHMDDEAMLRYRASVAENNGHDMAPVNYNSLRRIIARLDAAERERDALREALAKTAQPHFWWDTDDSENGCDDITIILDNHEIGEVVEVSCARNLPNQWAVGYVTESGGFRGQTFATEAEAVEFAAARAALTANHSAPDVEE